MRHSLQTELQIQSIFKISGYQAKATTFSIKGRRKKGVIFYQSKKYSWKRFYFEAKVFADDLFLQQDCTRMISLQQVDNFNNITNPYVPNITMERTVISPEGHFLLRYDPYNIRLYNLIEKTYIPITINTTIIKAVFSLEEDEIIFCNIIGISSYSVSNSTISPIILQSKANYITDFQINQDYTILYYLNQTGLASLNLKTLKLIASASNTKNCSAVKMKYDYNTQTIITSTLVNGQSVCFICKWNITNNNFVYSQSTNISFCVINDIYILNKQIALTKKKFNINLMNTIILDFQSLNVITTTSQTKSNGNPGFIVPYHNYYFQYFSLSNYIYVYKDGFANSPFTIASQFVISVQYNALDGYFYIISKDPAGNFNSIHTKLPLFNCSMANNTIYNASSPLSSNCVCSNGMVFNKSSFSCQPSPCPNSTIPCSCPLGNAFSDFTLQCQLSCTNISNAVDTQPFGSPSKCICQSPYAWNSTSNDCSSINCALLNHSSSSNISYSCSCASGFIWNSQYRFCMESNSDLPGPINPNGTNTNATSTSSSSPGSPVGLIIGLMIAFLVLIGSESSYIGAVLFYYYRKCRNGSNSEDDQQEQEPNPTARQLSEKYKTTHPPALESNEELKSHTPKANAANSPPQKAEKEKEIQENLDNFSIDEDEQPEKEQQFSQIESNIENPLH